MLHRMQGGLYMADGNSPNRLFLKKILYRIDFQFITEKIQEEVYTFISEKFGEYFIEQSQELTNEIDLEINVSSLEQPKLNKKSQPIFAFRQPKTDDCDGRTIKLGRTFLFLELDLRPATMGISYFDWIAEIINFLNGYPIFRLTRVGIRKFNNFFILDEHKNSLDDIFNISYISNVDCESFTLDNFSHAQEYTTSDYNLRFTRNYSSGNLSNAALSISNQPGHLISFDFDLFTMNDDKLQVLGSNATNTLSEMNGVLRNFFNSIIMPEIIEKLDAGSDLKEYNIIPY